MPAGGVPRILTDGPGELVTACSGLLDEPTHLVLRSGAGRPDELAQNPPGEQQLVCALKRNA